MLDSEVIDTGFTFLDTLLGGEKPRWSDLSTLYLFLAALIPQLIGHTALTWVLRFKRPTIVGIATVGESIGATFIGWVWLDAGVDATTALGCCITMTAVLLALYEPKH